MFKRNALLPSILLLLVLSACAMAPDLTPDEQGAKAVAPSAPVAEGVRRAAYSTTGPDSDVTASYAEQRMVIRTAELSLVVDDPGVSLEQITSLANESGGYVASARSEERSGFLVRTVTIRVPADRFDDILKSLRAMAVRVTSDSVQSQDVTEEYTDVEAQLRNLQATEQQYLTLLQRAQTIEDILRVEEKLSEVRGEIERLQGRKQYLERSTAMSLITVTLTPLQLQTQVLQPGWSVTQTTLEALSGGVAFVQALVTIAIWLIVLAVPTAIAVAPFWLLWRWVRRRRARSAAPGPQ